MASTKGYFEYISERLSGLDGVSFRPMMGEYLLYYRGKVVGGLYDDRLLVKVTDAGKRLMPTAAEQTPYDGAKPMLLADNVDDGDFLAKIVVATAAGLDEKTKNSGRKYGRHYHADRP